MNLPRSLLACACLLACASAQAARPSLQDDTRRLALEAIDRDPAWLALLHYRAHAGGGVASQADRPQFFLSANGRNAPREELLAAVGALHVPEREQEYACRFPARYEWLRMRLGHDGPGVIERCPQLAQWLAGFPGRRVSINFASSYLESPSSTFGHTFLKIFERSSDELLSPTINYAARTDARDSDLDFVVKGLFGGFPGVADQLPFYRRLRTYADTEGRDIHEYELDLTPAEVRRLLLHSWEIKDGVFDYYFLGENCAYRTLSLLDVARPQARLLNQFSVVTVPVDTIRALRAAGMVGAHRVWPSTPKRVRGLEAQVSSGDARLARQLALGLASSADAGTLQLAYEYASVLIDRDEGERASRKEILGAITRARLALAEPDPLRGKEEPASPEDGHDGGLIAFGLRKRGGQDALSLEYAAFQHTLTDPLPGYEPHAEITLLNPELLVRSGHVRLQRIDWLVAQSAIPTSALFAPRAWRVALSTRAKPFADRERMATSLAYQTGKAWMAGGGTVFSLLPGISVEAGSGLRHRVAAAAAFNAAITRQGEHWSAQLDMHVEKFIAGSTLRRDGVRATGELRLARNLSLALSAAQEWTPRRAHELRVSLKWRQRSLSGWRPAP